MEGLQEEFLAGFQEGIPGAILKKISGGIQEETSVKIPGEIVEGILGGTPELISERIPGGINW